MTTRSLLTLGGYVVGSFFGAPQIGLVIGALIGNAVDPVKTFGPRLSDSKIQTARDGVYINWGAGRFRCAGTIIAIQPGPPTEHEHTESQGKGGGPEQVTYTYTRTVAIMVCEGPVIGIRRIWRDQKLVYDTSEEPTEPVGTSTLQEVIDAWMAAKAATEDFAQKLTIYLGDETQLPDPELEALFGVGEYPAHRGYCYVVIKDDDVTDRAGSVSNYEFEVMKAGTAQTVSFANFVGTGGGHPAGSVKVSEDGDTWTTVSGVTGGETVKFSTTDGNTVYGWSTAGNFWKTDDKGQTWDQITFGGAFPGVEKMAFGNGFIVCIQNTGSGYRALYSASGGASWGASQIITTVTAFNDLHFGQGKFAATFGNTFGTPGIFWSQSGALWEDAYTGNDVASIWFNGEEWMAAVDQHVMTSPNLLTWTHHPDVYGPTRTVFAIVGGPGWWVCDVGLQGLYRSVTGGAGWSLVASIGAAALYEATIAGDLVIIGPGEGGSSGVYTSHDEGLTWAASNLLDAASINSVSGVGPDSVFLPNSVNWYVDAEGNYHTNADITVNVPDSVALSSFLADICSRSGLTDDDLDTSDIDDLMDGYLVARETQGDALINSLAQCFLFDTTEEPPLITFRKRGSASLVTVDIDDLCALDGPPVIETRDQEIERPRKVNVNYYDPELQYIPSKQTAERRATVSAVGETSIEIPVVMSKDAAAQVADKLIKISWTDQLGTVSFCLSTEFSYLVPADVLTLNYRDRIQRLRIEKLDDEAGRMMIQARQDRLSAVDSNATGIGDPQNPPYPVPAGATLFIAMNLPYLREQDNTPGVYFAARGTGAGWPGCIVQVSYDGGATYSNAVTIKQASTMGALTAPADDPHDSPATENISVKVRGEIASVTPEQIDAGANAWAILSSGVAEVGQVETVTDLGGGFYTLINPTRGQLGTEAVAHDGADPFVMLGNVYFFPVDSSFSGTTLYFRAVTIGTNADDGTVYPLVFTPADIIIDGGGDPL